MHLRNQLAALFSPTRRLIGSEPILVHGGGVLGALEWVVPRADCHYRRLDFGALPARQRAAAAQIAARQHEALADASFHVAWCGPIAHVWSWVAPPREPGAQETAWVPESLLRAPPEQDGPRLLQQVRGYEGQHWRDGQLVASQWWPEPPAPEAWRRFVRGCGLGAEHAAAVPRPLAMPWSAPWGDGRGRLPASPAQLERLAWTLGVGLLAAALGWQLAAQWGWSRAQARLDAELAALRAEATPLLAARERADAAREALQALRDLQQGVDDYRLMADVIAPLPADARLAGWQREGTRLQVAVVTPESDPRKFVSAYGRSRQLADVVAAPAETGRMRLEFTLPEAGSEQPDESTAAAAAQSAGTQGADTQTAEATAPAQAAEAAVPSQAAEAAAPAQAGPIPAAGKSAREARP